MSKIRPLHTEFQHSLAELMESTGAQLNEIYNFDETGVNYENLPSKIWLPQGTDNYKVKTKGIYNK